MEKKSSVSKRMRECLDSSPKPDEISGYVIIKNSMFARLIKEVAQYEKALRKIASGLTRRGRNISYGGGRIESLRRKEMMELARNVLDRPLKKDQLNGQT